MTDSDDEGVASSLDSGGNDAAQVNTDEEGVTEGVSSNMGVSEEAVWTRLTAETLSVLRPSEVRTALEESVPDSKLEIGEKIRVLAMWAMDWVKVRGRGVPDRNARKRKANARSHREEVAKNVLLYIKYLLQYNLCPSDCLNPIYEAFLTAMDHNKNLRPVLSDILCAITEARHVTKWRVALVSRMAQAYYKGASRKEWRAVVNMAHKFAYLRPEIVPQAMHRLKRSPGSAYSSSSKSSDALGYRFEDVWKARTPMDAQLDDLGPESRLTWQAEDVFRGPGAPEDSEDGEGPRKRRHTERPRVGARLGTITSGQEPNPIQEELYKHRKTKSEGLFKMPLSRCQKVGEVYDNLDRLAMPARTLSLLGNRGTFFLLMANPDREVVRKRLALSLHYVLYNEFFAAESGNGQSSLQRKSYILQRVARLQDFFQQGIPVVARFLAEFLSDWDGKTLFADVIKLLPYIQLTDFEELRDCIFQPLRKLFSSTFSPMERLLLLLYLHKLLLHWIGAEYERVTRLRTGSGSGGVFGRADSTGSGVDAGRSADEDANKAPLSAVAGLMEAWSDMAMLGLVKTFTGANGGRRKWITESGADNEVEVEGRRIDQAVYLNEVLTMYLITSRLLIAKDVPLRPDLPLPFVYLSLFSRSPVFLSRALDLVSSAKHESIPLCRRHLRHLEEAASTYTVGAEEQRQLVLQQLEDEDAHARLNTISKDVLAILTKQTVYLDQGQSIFRKAWTIEEDLIREHLNLVTHPAFMPFSQEFADKYAMEHNTSRSEVWKDLTDEASFVFDSFTTWLREQLPHVAMFLETFEKPKRSICSPKSAGTSVATSGVSSMQPRKRRVRTKRTLLA